jgi:fructokinase
VQDVRIVVAGEALIDLVPDADGRLRTLAGGSPFNVAIGLGRLGVPVGLLGPISSDPLGDLLASRLSEAGVAQLLPERTSRPTSLAMVHLDAVGHASYGFYLDGTSTTGMTQQDVAAASVTDPTIGHAVLHVSLGAVTLTSEGTGQLLGRMLVQGGARPLVTFDPNVRPAMITDMAKERAAIEAVVAAVDVVKVSDADLEAIAPDRDPLAVAGDWARSGPALVIVTRGERGATAMRSDGGLLTVAGVRVDVVDTVGAGDAFMSGLLAALHDRGLLERGALGAADAQLLQDVLAYAADVAAVTCTRKGADPPYRQELPEH